MIDLYWWKTSNGHKIAICLEEMGLDYRVRPIDISKDEQFSADFLKINPNGKIPAIVDLQPTDGGAEVIIFESAAILIYLAERSGQFLPSEQRARSEVLQWMMWQTSGFGPTLGQVHHFRRKAPPGNDYSVSRFEQECRRLYAVLETRLAQREHVCGQYSIADMMIYPWVQRHDWQGINLADFPAVANWFRRIEKRPAVLAAYRLAETLGV
ncbi:MAG: thiol:disulfide oxidoreductase [Tabrizicola sp.]|nr:thiol:disulfide oxidoreductase [Tabrizicola sp.]